MASENEKGPLSFIGDPLGKVLNVGLKPIGSVVGSIGNPNGEALLNVEKQAKRDMAYSDKNNNKPDKDLPGGERIGGNAQTGQNPLGL
ncbi:hypothetical protein PRZ48_007135 [Zasmidium cellare]|uniref:Uncharacterized protein n=1 Tax=Zasmidium cellare TaxID=395010 RepID=A0ABR0EIS4_ZASCE|nr:hypothetical protein PRZ48_007135 [Zasmidium cellare]